MSTEAGSSGMAGQPPPGYPPPGWVPPPAYGAPPAYGPPAYGPPPGYGPPAYGPPAYGPPPGYGPPPARIRCRRRVTRRRDTDTALRRCSLPLKPGVIPLRPLSLSDIFNGAIAYIRANPKATLGFTTIVVIATQLLALVLIGGTARRDRTARAVGHR